MPDHLPGDMSGDLDARSGSLRDAWEQWLDLRPPGPVSLEEVVERVEQYFVRWALTTTHHNRTRAAELLGLAKVDQLRYLQRKYGIDG